MGILKVGKEDWAPYVLREEWGAKPEGLMEKFHLMQLPITYVWFSYEDLLTKYQTTEHVVALQMSQKEHMAEGLYDIKYNFMISKEGVIYEGRGWCDEPFLPKKFEDLKFKCLNVLYIGDYSKEDPPWPVVRSGVKLIMHGIKEYFMKANFKIIPFREPTE